MTEWKKGNGRIEGTWWQGLWGGWRIQMGWNCSVSKCIKVGKVGIWINLMCCSHTKKRMDRWKQMQRGWWQTKGQMLLKGLICISVRMWHLGGGGGESPDWLGKCAKLAKLAELEVWVGGAAKMSPPRSDSKSNFFSWVLPWGWERGNPGDWVTGKTDVGGWEVRLERNLKNK